MDKPLSTFAKLLLLGAGGLAVRADRWSSGCRWSAAFERGAALDQINLTQASKNKAG